MPFTLPQVALLEKYFPLATDLHQLVQFCLTVSWLSLYAASTYQPSE